MYLILFSLFSINNVDSWSNLVNGKTGKIDFIIVANPIFNILFRDNKNLKMQTVRQFILDAYNVKAVSARKIDIGKYEYSIMCAIEWKKKNTTPKKLLIQQTKNLRANKCHLTKILKLQLSNA
ncbi:hypothetical protein BDA99DRAFT_542844 [Phascolomyces articulosus]|uniref:Homing endonuclease LAGLIDADG domain-containing protein n=1 Tax=Phascolomyces articulosus TaxID=60185 RepID=A0AAD5P8B6_9FUNG|nr:hypothetical protein BDA99DRAFT_542844 [Phascolomyces articulosus]